MSRWMLPVSFSVFCFSLTLSGLSRPPALAQTPALDYSSAVHTGSVGASFMIGYQFAVNTNVTVTDLGADFNGGSSPGIFPIQPPLTPPTSVEVGLWDSGGTLLASTTVLNTATADGNFRYTPIAPITLSAGSDYTVAGLYAPYTTFVVATTGLTTDPAITYVAPRLLVTGSLTEPTSASPFFSATDGDFGGSFRLTPAPAVPEPGTCTLLASLGLTAMTFLRRRRAH